MIFCLVISFASCDKITDQNVDPNKSPTARDQELLTSALGYTAWIIDGRYNELAFQWGQYWTWGPGVSLGNSARYVAEPDDHNNVWARSYNNALADLRVIGKSDDQAFRGVSKVMTAYIYQGLVDHFGDVPYEEALLGEIEDGSILSPNFDDAAGIYADLILVLDDAISDFELATTHPEEEDLLYGGNLSAWTKFAKSLKLRMLMRQQGVVDVEAQVTDLIREDDLIASAEDMAIMAMSGTAGSENPMFAVRESGIGNFYIASNTSLDKLRELSDPRINALYDMASAPDEEITGPIPADGIVGVDHGGINELGFGTTSTQFSKGSAITYAADAPVIFMSDWEVWFLVAEAGARWPGIGVDDAAAFANGVAASFDYLGVDGADAYTSSLGYGGSLNDKIKHIAVQKWIACNGLQEDEGWIESRRLDTPDNPIFTDLATGIYQTPVESALSPGVHPSAFLYPQSEVNLNPNTPAQRSLTDKVFWDN